MNKVLFALLVLVSASSAYAGYTPVSGSCSRYGMGPDLCSCDLRGSLDGSVIHSDTVPCQELQCSDFQDAHGCGDMKSASCELSNRYYTGECAVSVLYDPAKSSALESCTQVQRELNTTFSYGHNYCDATSIRGGWNLDSAQ